MKISEFITKFNSYDTAEDKQKFILENVKNDYVPYEVKIGHCQSIIESSVLDKDGNVDLKTPIRYMLLVLVFIQDHMDIEFGDIDNVTAFNSMEQYGVDDAICGTLDDEFKVYQTVLDMMVNDTLDKKRNYVDFVTTLFSSIANSMDGLTNDLQAIIADAQAKANATKPASRKKRTTTKKVEANGG